MTKTVSANDAKNRLGSLLGYVSEQNDEVIVERHGKPRAVIMSVAAYEEVQALREEKRRAEILKRFERLNERLAAHNAVHNADLSEEEAIELSVQIGRELIDEMAARGVITFERDLR